MRTVVSLALALTVAPAAEAWDEGCRYEAPREASVDAQGARALRVLARSGALAITGEAGRRDVVVRGRACAHDEETLESIRLIARRSGDEVRVEAELPKEHWGWGTYYARLDLELLVPASLAADVEDTSGEIEIRGVASLRLDDNSGGLRVLDVPGEVRIRDGSGEIEVERVGSLLIEEDGSGEIEVRDVKGDVRIREDGSGSIVVRGVGGSVTIGDDGSGGVRVTDVAGDLTVDGTKASRIRYSDVRGRVSVPER